MPFAMISDFLIGKIKDRFPNRSFTQSISPNAVITFPAAHPEVGDLSIYDDGDEARVEISKLTHGHFGCWDQSLNKAEREADVAETVVDFVEQIFAEKVIFFIFMGGRAGGWRPLKEGESHPKKPFTKYYYWSGPIAD
jgi:hypothetical protein